MICAPALKTSLSFEKCRASCLSDEFLILRFVRYRSMNVKLIKLYLSTLDARQEASAVYHILSRCHENRIRFGYNFTCLFSILCGLCFQTARSSADFIIASHQDRFFPRKVVTAFRQAFSALEAGPEKDFQKAFRSFSAYQSERRPRRRTLLTITTHSHLPPAPPTPIYSLVTI